MPGPPLQQLNLQVVVPPFTAAPVADSTAAGAEAAGAKAAEAAKAAKADKAAEAAQAEAAGAEAGAPARPVEQSPTLYIAIGLAVLIIALIAAFALKRGAA